MFRNYKIPGRGPLSRESIVASTGGEHWSTFYPMLIPKDQFDTDPKDCYVFRVLNASSSTRFAGVPDRPRFLITLPFSSDVIVNAQFMKTHQRRFAKYRVAMGESFSMEIEGFRSSLAGGVYELTIGFGDSQGNAVKQDIAIPQGGIATIDGLTALHYVRLHDAERALIGTRKPSELLRVRFACVEGTDIEWLVTSASFEDICVYENDLYLLGWITADDFDRARMGYPALAPNATWDGNGPHREADERGLLSRRSFCYF